MMRTRLLMFAVVFISLLGFAGVLIAQLRPPELSADMTMYSRNKIFDEGKFYVGKTAGRLDMLKKARQTHVFHFNADKIEIWMHQPKTIMEMKMRYNALINYKPAGFSEVCSGEEVIDGRPCQKCVMTGKFGGKDVKTTVWKAKDLKGMVIKNLDDEGNGSAITNIITGPQPESLFQPPAGYRKMSLPGGMENILKGFSN